MRADFKIELSFFDWLRFLKDFEAVKKSINGNTFEYKGRIFKTEYSNETKNDMKANVITSVSLSTSKGFRAYTLDKGSVDLDKNSPINPEHTINFKLT